MTPRSRCSCCRRGAGSALKCAIAVKDSVRKICSTCLIASTAATPRAHGASGWAVGWGWRSWSRCPLPWRPHQGPQSPRGWSGGAAFAACQQGMNSERQRLQKVLSQAGVCSRRRAEELMRQGRVLLNGRPASPAIKAIHCAIASWWMASWCRPSPRAHPATAQTPGRAQHLL